MTEKPGRTVSLKARFENRVARSASDRVLTPFLTIGGLILTAVGVAGGVWLSNQPVDLPVPGSKAGPWPFLGNVLANLILIGPALVITNYLVPYVQRARSDHRAMLHFAVIGLLLAYSIDAANDYLETLGSDKRCEPPPIYTKEGMIDLAGERVLMQEAKETIEQASGEFIAKSGSKDLLTLPIKGESFSYNLPDFAGVRTFVGLLEREFPCPFALLAVTNAEAFSQRCHINFVWQGQGSRLRPPGKGHPRISEPRTGFGEITIWLRRAARTATGQGTLITVDVQSYYDFVRKCLNLSDAILKFIVDAAPTRLLPKPQANVGGTSELAEPAEPEHISKSEIASPSQHR